MPLLKAQRRVRAHCPEQEKSLVRVYAKDVVEEESTADARCERRSVLCRLPLLAALPLFIPFPQPAMAEVAAPQGATSTFAQPDTTITNKVALDISIAPRSFKTPNERTLGDKTVLPIDDAVPVGRLVLGLYGNTAPGTVGNFLRLIRSGALRQTTFSKVLPGEYIQAGQQASFRLGGVDADSSDLQPNPDLSSSRAFKLQHLRPGTLSLSLTENDEDPLVQAGAGYRNVQFLITTGPGPVPRLDGQNIVFGRVLEGLDVVNTISQVPTFKPSDNARQLNVFAQSIGDDRAVRVRRKYGKPLKAVIIMQAMELPLDGL